jgi:hypothetical protein
MKKFCPKKARAKPSQKGAKFLHASRVAIHFPQIIASTAQMSHVF